MDFQINYLEAFNTYCESLFQENVSQAKLFEAMRYSLNAGGKRLRPIFVMEFCRTCGKDWHSAMPAAAAIELIHTYSLIHDDLPCMDNDDYRRGKLTNHKVYGEATAVLAGDGLLTHAFYLLAASGNPNVPACVAYLSRCSGPYGMVGGQQMDLDYENQDASAEVIAEIEEKKTCELFKAACVMGVLFGGGTPEQITAAESYATNLGKAFQIRDDILDLIGDSKVLGKQTGKDENKSTLLKHHSIDDCEKIIMDLTGKAIESLTVFQDSENLREIAYRLSSRNY